MGTDALELFETKATTTPFEGAGPFNETCPAEEVPPTTVMGDIVRLSNSADTVIFRGVLTVAPPDVAAIVAVTSDVNADVEIENVACLRPGGTTTKGGRTAAELVLDR